MLNAKERRERILRVLSSEQEPISATALAMRFDVSRQVIVGDIALLRASGCNISSTPKGYVCHTSAHPNEQDGYIGILACSHSIDSLAEELYTVVDFGGILIDVSIEHSIYGQITAPLDIRSRYDADLFLDKIHNAEVKPLSDLTGGIHLHRAKCADERAFLRIKNALSEKGILLNQD